MKNYETIASDFLLELTEKVRIKAIREARNLTKEQFGKKIGVTRKTVANWEKGTTRPTPNNLMKIYFTP